jgi:hypothetical protein
MTEAEWMACGDPTEMLDFLRSNGKASDRKFRLIAAACCRRIWRLFEDVRSREAVLLVERLTENDVSREQLEQVEFGALSVTFDRVSRGRPLHLRYAAVAAANAAATEGEDPTLPPAPYDAADSAARAVVEAVAALAAQTHDVRELVRDAMRTTLCSCIRDVVGLPFRPPSLLSPLWLAWNHGTVAKLAAMIYEERRFEDAPVLADSLEEAGCTDAELLGHLRGLGRHFLGCWALDLLLGKG